MVHAASTLKATGIAAFWQGLRAAVYGLWRGEMDVTLFHLAMETAIRRGLRMAWVEGLREVGMEPDELWAEEMNELEMIIQNQLTYVQRFGEFVMQNSRANGGKLQTCLDRAQLWLNVYNQVRSRALVIAAADRKFKWRLGATEQHCADCLAYNGRVYRASLWREVGALPQSRTLECGGWRCDCRLEPTSERAFPGRPPAPYALRGGV